MVDYDKLTSTQILAFEEPEDIFTKDGFDHEYKQLAKLWHPDVNKTPKATDVFKHIFELHQLAGKKYSAGTWAASNLLVLTKLLML